MYKKIIKIVFVSLIIFWCSFCVAVRFFPKYFFYGPSNEKSVVENAQKNYFPATEVYYKSSDNTDLYAWFVKPKANNKIVVFFHGNSHNIEVFYHKLVPFIENGYGAFIGEYRGFGGIKGKLSQENLGNDAIAAVKYLNDQGYSNDQLILYGMSMGSYTSTNTAATLGKENPFAALILEVPFDSILEVVKQRIIPLFPFELIVKDKFDNTKLIRDIKSPVLIMGATRDKVVPIERAKALFEIANEPKKIIIYQGAGHSSLYNYRNWKDILNWLQDNEKTE